jgi:hypothetical protein
MCLEVAGQYYALRRNARNDAGLYCTLRRNARNDAAGKRNDAVGGSAGVPPAMNDASMERSMRLEIAGQARNDAAGKRNGTVGERND